jgi:hemerythrin
MAGRGEGTTPDRIETSEDAWKRVQQEHRKIVALLTDLGEAKGPERILEVVNELGGILPGHFADEEGPRGFFEEIRMLRPDMDPRLRRLHQQHGEIVQALDAVVAQAAAKTKNPAGIERTTSALCEMLRAHERIENQLITDFYLTDEGGAG